MRWFRNPHILVIDPLKMGPTGCPETSVRNTTNPCVITLKNPVLVVGSYSACH